MIWRNQLPRWLSGKEYAYNARVAGLISGWGGSPREGNSNLLSLLAWEIPWTEEIGRLPSMEWQSLTPLSN